MIPRALFAIPGDLATLTGGYGYDRRVLDLLPSCGVDAVHVELPASFPFPAPADVAATLDMLCGGPRDAVLLVDGLAFGALPMDAVAAIPQKIVALVHHPLGYEPGLSHAQSLSLIASERDALNHAAHIIVTSRPTRDTLIADFNVDPARIAIAEPGTDPADRAKGSDGAPQILAVGSIVPRKAFDVLVTALAELAQLPWTLRIVGSPDRAPATAAALRAQIAASSVADRIELASEMDAPHLDRAYAAADLFVLPSLYEGYGMVLAEAMARGLPIICTTGGAATKTVPDDAGFKVPPGDAVALRSVLAKMLGDAALRRRLGENSWRAGQSLPRWADTAAIVADVIKHIAGAPA